MHRRWTVVDETDETDACPVCDGEGEVSGYDVLGYACMFTCRTCGGSGERIRSKSAPPELQKVLCDALEKKP
jgi:DnaJ-class molecular chaperone